MSAPNDYPSSASFIPRERSPASQDDADDRYRKWHDKCVLEVDPADIADDALRRAAFEIGNHVFGRRAGKGS